MNKKSFASTIIAVILVCPVLAVTHTFTPTDIESLKVKMSDGSLQPGDVLIAVLMLSIGVWGKIVQSAPKING